jgi:hypothetical protein
MGSQPGLEHFAVAVLTLLQLHRSRNRVVQLENVCAEYPYAAAADDPLPLALTLACLRANPLSLTGLIGNLPSRCDVAPLKCT